jgi:hypothetical protein
MEREKYTWAKLRMDCGMGKDACSGPRAVSTKEFGRTIGPVDKGLTSKMGQSTLEFSKKTSFYRGSTSQAMENKSMKEDFVITSSKEKDDYKRSDSTSMRDSFITTSRMGMDASYSTMETNSQASS